MRPPEPTAKAPPGLLRRPATGASAGFTFIEVTLVMVVALVAVMIFSGTVGEMAKQRRMNWETGIAANASRIVLENMRNEDLDQVFALYNAVETDDPGGVGSAPGNRFAVDGLPPASDSPDGLIGEVFFPTVNLALLPTDVPILELRERAPAPELGMPRDLNGDNIIDVADHSSDYIVLPVRIVLRWRGLYGDRQHSTSTLLCVFNTE